MSSDTFHVLSIPLIVYLLLNLKPLERRGLVSEQRAGGSILHKECHIYDYFCFTKMLTIHAMKNGTA
jgi:hypothetical protein